MILLNPELKKLFGKWEWVETSGGFAGKIITPQNSGRSEEVEFTKHGIYMKYNAGYLLDKKKFNITEGKSILNKNKVYLISFSADDSSITNSVIPQSVSFGGYTSSN